MNEAERVVFEAQMVVIAEGIKSWIPDWFYKLTADHTAVADQLRAAGAVQAAAVFDEHGPVLDDGVGCRGGLSQYPCAALRSVHDGEGVWSELVKDFPDGWESEPWNECQAVPEERWS